LTDWFKFSEPNLYQITAIYQIGLLDERARTVWDDFVVARCLVRITAAEPANGPAADSARHDAGT
jgi:hypothetical protein